MGSKNEKEIYKCKTIRLFATDVSDLFVIRNSRTGSSLLFDLKSVVELKRFIKDYFFTYDCRSPLAFRGRFRWLEKDLRERFIFLTEKCGVTSNFIAIDEADGITKVLDFVIEKYGVNDKTNKGEIIDTIKKIKAIKIGVDQ